MAYLLPESRYDDIRSVLDPTVDEDALGDDIISAAVYQGQAEAWVKALDPLWATRAGTELESLHLAIIYRIAGMISPLFPQAKQVNLAGHTATFNYGETVQERTARLLQQAFDVVVGLVPSLAETEVPDGPFFVTTVSGRRA